LEAQDNTCGPRATPHDFSRIHPLRDGAFAIDRGGTRCHMAARSTHLWYRQLIAWYYGWTDRCNARSGGDRGRKWPRRGETDQCARPLSPK
jgi:hypothetical protein